MAIDKLVMGGNDKAGKEAASDRKGKEVASNGKGKEVASNGKGKEIASGKKDKVLRLEIGSLPKRVKKYGHYQENTGPANLKVLVFNDEGIEVVANCGPHHKAFDMDAEGAAAADGGVVGAAEGGAVDAADGA